MANAPARTPIFPRGTVLDYWLANAEGLVVQPGGARVEQVVAEAPSGRVSSLVVRTPVLHRLRMIPAEAFTAVDPATGTLHFERGPGRIRTSAARTGVVLARGGHAASAAGGRAARSTRAGTSSAAAWTRPRAIAAGATAARSTRTGAALAARSTRAGTSAAAAWTRPRAVAACDTAVRSTRAGAAWLVPRVVHAARVAGTATVRFAGVSAIVVGRAARVAAALAREGAVRGREVSRRNSRRIA